MVQNVEMKTAIYCCLGIVFVTCDGLAVFLLHGAKEKETWSTLAAVLAVFRYPPNEPETGFAEQEVESFARLLRLLWTIARKDLVENVCVSRRDRA